ncbi:MULTISPECIES: YhdB family protein [Priestia]|uniref:YhdB family protein n=1 Tax=Priestia flexa TaxID=86664 RepID=A0ABU4J2S0_9BACI|nr:YhdB family protein [Priestia flexa]MBY6087060.1 YhdB family protein [Priestia flexa]MCA1202702.1 YhdB family protein [Priestia flexa]MCG7314051.1 YhdB family protein [Priestia flexa]MCM3066756.1 YhdB family protein [Priestia flexa]MDW8515294.1 YhdB family protein [Priestia flexa]
MDTIDYDRALYYTNRSQWDNLLILMVRTQDDFLSKKIEHFLHAYNFERNYRVIQEELYSLLRYIDHASELSEHNLNDFVAVDPLT